jgi:hypothetical protein
MTARNVKGGQRASSYGNLEDGTRHIQSVLVEPRGCIASTDDSLTLRRGKEVAYRIVVYESKFLLETLDGVTPRVGLAKIGVYD